MSPIRTLAATALAVLAVCAVLATPRVAATYPNGSPGGFAGNNADNGSVRTCATSGCHSSYGLDTGTGGVRIDVPAGVQPGQTVTVTVSVDNTTPGAPGSATGPRQGFEATARTADGAYAGTFTVLDAATTRTTYGSEPSMTHRESGTTQPSWTFEWTAPDAPAEVTFYAAGNAANGGSLPGQTNNASGDYIYTTTQTVRVGAVAGESGPAAAAALRLGAPHPNPVRTGTAALVLTLAHAGPVRVRIVDGRGRTVREVSDAPRAAGETRLDVPTRGLAPGLYIVVAEAGGRRAVQTVTVAR